MSFTSSWVSGVSALVAVSAAWWASCGWDTRYSVDADGSVHGPYSAWQVAAFALVILMATAWAGLRRAPLAGAVGVTVAATVNWSVSASTTGEEPNLWPVGAVLVLTGSAVGSLAVAFGARRLTCSTAYRRRYDRFDH